MKVYYDEHDLVTFGEYLLSEERAKRIESNWDSGDSVSLEERKSQIYHADLENWKEKQRSEALLTA